MLWVYGQTAFRLVSFTFSDLNVGNKPRNMYIVIPDGCFWVLIEGEKVIQILPFIFIYIFFFLGLELDALIWVTWNVSDFCVF